MKSWCRFRKSRRDDTSYPLGIPGCNKSPNQVDIWRMERWNWFLAASKSHVCQDGRRVMGENPGERRTPDRFPAGFMPLFFIRPVREDVVHCVTVPGILSLVVPFFRACVSVSLRFWHAARILHDINATENIVESFNQSAPMTLGIRPRVQFRNETLLPEMDFAVRIKKWLIELPAFAAVH